MPFIDCKITQHLTEDKKEAVKAKLGKAVSIIKKPESYLMVGINDGYTLYFAGRKLENGAYVSVSLFGSAAPRDYDAMTAEVCKILSDELNIPGNNVYVTYHPVSDWGWAGSNF